MCIIGRRSRHGEECYVTVAVSSNRTIGDSLFVEWLFCACEQRKGIIQKESDVNRTQAWTNEV